MGTILKRSTGIKFELHKGQVGELNQIEATRLAARNEIGRAHKETASYRMAFLLAMAMLVPAVLWGIWVSTMGIRDHVHLAKVNMLNGDEEWLTRAPTKPTKPEQSVIQGVVQNWVEAIRAISNDRNVFDENWDRIRAYTTQVAWRQLEAFRKEQDQRQLGGLRVGVTLGRFLPVQRSARSYRITWKEVTWDMYGQCLEEQSGWWEASVLVADFTSQAALEAWSLLRKQRDFRNVFGVFIDEPSWKITIPDGGKRACDSM